MSPRVTAVFIDKSHITEVSLYHDSLNWKTIHLGWLSPLVVTMSETKGFNFCPSIYLTSVILNLQFSILTYYLPLSLLVTQLVYWMPARGQLDPKIWVQSPSVSHLVTVTVFFTHNRLACINFKTWIGSAHPNGLILE